MTPDNLLYVKPLIERILRAPLDTRHHSISWSIQGFGMMRTYFGPAAEPKRFRLNLWDSRFTVPGVSTVHDHPWHFKSIIVAGAFCNVRFDIENDPRRASHEFVTIKTGEGGGPVKSQTELCTLHPRRPELYKAGDEYHQASDEIHETIYSDGCITLNERTRVGDGEHARVFWPAGTSWVDAEPREATPSEVKAATEACLAEWF